nr:four-carbon acid sugar kinase family protein [Megamonas funiformis]
MIKLAVIADDLTGANDTALQFAKRNIKSSVEINFMQMEDIEDKEVVVVDTDSRDLDEYLSYKRVKDICEKISRYNIKCVYKKIDSTLRGNLGAEIKAVDDVFKPDIVIIAPAYPANQRITIGGYHLLEGKPIELTEIANAPKTPVKKSYLPAILQEQVNKNIAVIDFKIIRQGANFINKKISKFIDQGRRWIVCDIIEEENFITLMDAVKEYKNILWVGSAGLAEYLPYYYRWSGEKVLSMDKRKGAILVCAGSVSHITQNQVQTLLNQENIHLVKINMVRLLEDKNSELIEKSRIINQLIKEQENILLATAQSDDEVEQAVEIGKKYNLSQHGFARDKEFE